MDNNVPLIAWAIITGMATVGTLLFAKISLERVERDPDLERRRKDLRIGITATILIFLSFSINMWTRMYLEYHKVQDLIGIIIVTVWPLIAVAVNKKKAITISICILAATYFLGVILIIIMSVAPSLLPFK